jgi:4-amino-4-deoxy-L-arabinose transferase-like glycosyltransferase
VTAGVRAVRGLAASWPLLRLRARHWALAGGGLATAAAAAAVRFPGLRGDGFNSDEAVYAGQAAAIAGFQPYVHLFGVFRAHPLLVHFLVAVGYELTGVNDWTPRVICAAFGVGLALACMALAWTVRGPIAGLTAGAVAALAAYPVTISRQVLLDGPMAAFVALTLLFAALWLRSGRRRWLYAASAAAGLAFVTKETGVLLVVAGVLFLIASPRLPLRSAVDLPVMAAVYLAVGAPYPLSLALAGGGQATGNFVVWQLLRQPNHTPDFYLTVVPGLGAVTLGLAAAGLGAAIRRGHPMDGLAVAVIGVFLAFFQAWPTKGYPYLLPLVPPLAYLAGRGADGAAQVAVWAAARLRPARAVGGRRPYWVVGGAAVAAAAASLLTTAGPDVPQQTMAADSDASSGRLVATAKLAGSGGLPAARPAGEWVRGHTPEGAVFVTIGPSFGNVIQFYGQRKALALSVSPNPLRRNPTYEPIANPDASIRSLAVQYLVYDAYSAARSPFFAGKLLGYVRKFDGVPVYTHRDPRSRGPTVVIYQVHP